MPGSDTNLWPDRLKAVLEPFVYAALTELSRTVRDRGGLPTRRRAHVSVSGGSATTSEWLAPDWGMALSLMDKPTSHLAGFEALLEVIQNDQLLADRLLIDAGGNPVQRDQQASWLADYWLRFFLLHYLETRSTTAADPRVFGDVWEDLKRRIETNETRCVAVLPLYGFAGPEADIPVGRELHIRPIREDERDRFWESATSPFPTTFSSMDVMNWSHVISLTYVVFGFGSNGPPNDAQRLIESLRLLEAGRVGSGLCWNHPQGRGFGYFEYFRSSGLTGLTPLAADAFSLGAEDIPRLVRLFEDYQGSRARESTSRLRGRLEFALERFNWAYGRISAQDRLIDDWMALESIFASDAQIEVSYRASVRIARFLEDTPAKRKALAAWLRKSYSCRSRIVHGDAHFDVAKYADGTEDVLRRALRKIIEVGTDYDPEQADFS